MIRKVYFLLKFLAKPYWTAPGLQHWLRSCAIIILYRVVVPGGEGVGGAKKKDKEYELCSSDEFWLRHKGSPFPQVISRNNPLLS